MKFPAPKFPRTGGFLDIDPAVSLKCPNNSNKSNL
jgi:hypothetical protein